MQRTAVFGGPGGDSFDDSHFLEAWGRIRQITVRHGLLINGIGMSWDNGYMQYHGGSGGELALITLHADEWISAVSGKALIVVVQLTFTTNKGRQFGPFGGRFGRHFREDFAKADKTGLLYIFGASGVFLNRIGFGYGVLPKKLESVVIRSEPKGGMGGSLFDDLIDAGTPVGKIERIRVKHGSRIESIEVVYFGNLTMAHGGRGGAMSDFVLGKNEYITAVRGKYGWGVNQIQFFLNTGRVSPAYGGNGGTPYILEMDGHVVKSFFGRSGGRVDQIGVAFVKAFPVNYEILEMVYSKAEGNINEQPPMMVDSLLLENPTNTPQKIDKTITVTVTETHKTSITETHGVSATASFLGTFAVLVVGAQAGGSVGYSYQHAETTERTITITRPETFTFSPIVQANEKLLLTYSLKKQEYAIPWNGTARVTYADKQHSVPEKIHGLLQGVSSTQIDAKYERVE